MPINKTLANRFSWIGFGTVSVLLFLSSGCEPYNVSSLAATDAEIAAVQQAEEQQQSAQQEALPASTPEAPPLPPTSSTPEVPVVEPPPVPQGGFVWEPRGDSVRVVIPANLAHWQFHVFSRLHHFTLYGPDNRGGSRDVAIEYILPGGPGVWAARSSSVDPSSGGQLLVYVNTRDGQATGTRSAGWRILNPHQAYYGDAGIRLQPGENR